MTKFSSILSSKRYYKIKSRIFTGLILVLISLVLNHLTENENLLFSKSYSFPLSSTLISIAIGTIVLIIADLNFKHFKDTYFLKNITSKSLIIFLLTTLGYITIIYIPIYYFLVRFKNGDYEFYYLFTGLSLTLLLSSLGVIVVFAKDIYKLHRLKTISGKINIKKDGKSLLVSFDEVAYIYSENKIVYLVKLDGSTIITDFTLNEVEDQINDHLFFRANRQTILHFQSVEQLKSIENGKLEVTLKHGIFVKDKYQIIVSRYKKKLFEKWLQHKIE